MSKGPGRIERAIRELFDTHPDLAFTTDDLYIACYPGLDCRKIAHKHVVAVMRAANKLVAVDPDWRATPAPLDRRMLIFCNRASVPSMIMRYKLHGYSLPVREQEIRRSVRQHIAVRNADPAERERLEKAQEAKSAERLSELAQGIRATLGRRPYVLTTANGDRSSTLTALADRARTLLTQNDPDAVRTGLREIADALDQLGGT